MSRGIDVSKLSDDELFALNQEILAVVKARHRLQHRRKLLSFDVGDRVDFKAPEGGQRIRGTVVRVNQKSVTIATEGGIWRVDPSFVAKEKTPTKTKNGNVFQIKSLGN